MDDKIIPSNLPVAPSAPSTPLPAKPEFSIPQPSQSLGGIGIRPVPPAPVVPPTRPAPVPVAPSFQVKPPATAVAPISGGGTTSTPSRVDSLSIPKIQSTPVTTARSGATGQALSPAPRPTPPSSPIPPPIKPLTPPVPAPVALPKPLTGSFSVPTTPTTLKSPLTLPTSIPSIPPKTAPTNLNVGGIGTPPNDVALKSSIRTMQDDLANIKKGQTPIGIELQKPVAAMPLKPALPPTAPKPAIPPSPISRIQVELGKAQVARPLGQPSAPTPAAPLPKIPTSLGVTISGVAIPKSGGAISKRNLYLVIIGAIIVLGVAGYFVYGRYFSATSTPTPVATTATPPPTPVLSGLEAIFGKANPVTFSTNPEPADYYLVIQNSVSQTGNPGEISFYNTSAGSNMLGFSSFLIKLGISHPSSLDTLNDPQGFLLSATTSNVATNKKNLAMVVSVSDPQGVTTVMKTWESTAPNDLKTLFGFDPKKKSSPAFLDNSYQSVAIRYMNFPDANSTVDYAVVSTQSGSSFLIIASSKTFIYSLIDILLNSQPR